MEEERQEQNSANMSKTSSSAIQKGISSAQKNVANATSATNLKAKVFTKLAPMLGPVIFWAMVVVIAIVIVVGIGTFLMTTPGIIMDKLEKIAGNVVDALQHYFLGDSLTENVKEEEIVGVLDYLEDMNYDLKGYGFLSSFVDEEEKTYENGKPTGTTQYKDDEADGVIRYTEDSDKHLKGDIKEADSKYIFMYLVSDNYIYTVKNNNIAFETGEGPLGALASLYIGNIVHATNYVTQLIDTFTSFHTAGLTSQVYGQGLINFFYERDGKFGVQGAAFGNDISNQIELDQEKKTLKIKHSDGLFWANKSEMEYKVDGWAGRYGMPLEFLLSVHIATMMPDLAYDMVQLFPTEVQTYLHYVAGFSTEDEDGNEETVNTYIPYIAKVVNHWYRDVYFVQPEDENTKLVQVDAEYETLVKERWTLYETYTASEAAGYGNKNLAGEYKLYGLKENGEYATAINEVKNSDKAEGKLQLATTEDGHNYVLFVGTIEEANPTLSIMRNNGSNQNGQIEDVEDNRIPVAKKALTISFSDMTGNKNNDAEDKSKVSVDTDNETDESQNNDPIYNLRLIFRNNFPSGDDRPLAQMYTDTAWDDIAIKIRNTEEAQKEIKMYVSGHSEDYAFNIEQLKLALSNWNYAQEEGQSDWDYITEHRTKLIEMGGDSASYYNAIVDGWADNITKDEIISLVQKINNSSDASDITEMINSYANSIRENVSENIIKNPIEYKEDDINDYGWYRTEGVWTAYKLEDDNTFTQEGEGLRTETNPIIKQLFTCNTYFRYDGTKDTAEAIQQLREAYEIGETSLDFYAKSQGKNLDEVLKYKTQLLSESGEEKGNPITIDEVSGQVALNQDSLNAFSILENTHTLDSDYIYRDFKELVVELGYFTKEELTESIPRILAWVIPDTGSYGFPYNELDKKVNDFGTLIHSKGDIDTMKKMIMQRIMDEEAERVKSGTSESLNVSGKGIMEGLENSLKNEEDETDEDENENLLVSNAAFLKEVGSSGYTGEHHVYREAHAEPLHRKIEHTPSLDTLDSEGYQDIIEDGNVQYKHYLQYQGPYKGNQYRASGTISSDGCGPTSVANLLSGYGQDVTPAEVAAWAMEDIGHRDGPGPQLKHFEMEYDFISGVERSEYAEALINAFNEGKPVIALMPPASPDTFWTSNGHYVCLIGIDEEGRMITADPASMEERRISCENGINDIVLYLCALWIPKEAPSGVKRGEKYNGYEGNEAVVSPVTGILLEYGTYSSDDKDERVNSDINCKEIDEKYRLTSTEEDYKDKLGYAKIMVLDAENYKKLEAGTNSRFKGDSLLKSEYNSEGINQKFEEKLENEDDLEDWSAIDQTIYGYKEFAELYEKTGIAGNIIYIDGFKCEDVVESDEKGPDKVFNGKEEIKFDKFDVSEEDIEDKDGLRPSLYERDAVYKDMNLKITERLKAEGKTKSNAVSSIGIDAAGGKIISNFDNDNGDRLVFIKEGTVLGRTITDKELMENIEYRNKKLGTYEDVRGKNPKVIGNYIRIIMRNSDDDSIIENVEDYMKLDEGEVKDTEINEWVLFYWCPYECGPWDGEGNGPEQVENHNVGGGEFSTGICQWTTTGEGHSAGSFDEIKKLCTFAANYDSAYSNMTSYGDLSISEKLSNFDGLNSIIKTNCSLDREKFLKMEVECALWQFLGGEYYEKYGNLGFAESELAQTYTKYPWVESRPDIIKGTVMSMAIRYGSEVPAKHGISDSLTDQEIIDKIKEYFSKDSNRGEVQFNVANDYYKGKITDEDIETWVRTGHLEGHPEYEEK